MILEEFVGRLGIEIGPFLWTAEQASCAFLSETLVQVALFRHVVVHHCLDVIGRPLVSQYHLNLLDNFNLQTKKKQYDIGQKNTYIEVSYLLVLLPLVKVFDLLSFRVCDVLHGSIAPVVFINKLLASCIGHFATIAASFSLRLCASTGTSLSLHKDRVTVITVFDNFSTYSDEVLLEFFECRELIVAGVGLL